MDQERFADPLLRLVLMVCGVAMVVGSAVLLLVPMSFLEALLKGFVCGRPDIWADSSMFFYLVRGSGAAWLWLGATFIMAAEDPGRYAGWIFLSGLMLLLLGLVCLVSGVNYGLPAWLYLGDVIPAGIGGILLVRFRPKSPPS